MSLGAKQSSQNNNEPLGKSYTGLDNSSNTQKVREVPIEDEAVKEFCSKIYSTTHDVRKGLCMVKPYDQVFFSGYLDNYHQRIQEFEVFDDDVWISTFPRSGK